MNSRINHKSLPERTADAISYMLHRENYSVGQKLPNELEMATQFEVSRSTIRKAQAILAEKGILTIERGSGTFVSGKLGIENDPLGLSFIYDKAKLTGDLLQLRLMIEPTCAALAAQNASPADIRLMKQLCERMEQDMLGGKAYLQRDMELHQAIANSCGNSVIHNLIPYIHQMQILHETQRSGAHRRQTLKEHRRIIHAIEQHRGQDAFEAMQLHLMVVYGRLTEKTPE